MRIRHFLSAGAALAAVIIALPASAAPLLFDYARGSSTAQFQLDSNPVPDFARTVIAGSDQFGFRNVPGIYVGVPGVASTISFGSGIIADFNIVAPGLGFTQFGTATPLLFTGPVNAPVFTPGVYQLSGGFGGAGTLTISQVNQAIPEPATWALLLMGFAAVGGMARASRRGRNVSVSYT